MAAKGGQRMQAKSVMGSQKLSRRDFPSGFIFGTSSSCYQYEGAVGRGPNIWDTFTNLYPEKVKDKSNGNVANFSFGLYKEDVRVMKEMGVDAYRFSISWARVLPGGKASLGKSTEGIRYYNDLINELVNNGIKPFVTLFHWDVPQGLEHEYVGFLSPKIVPDFCDYAELCFKEFGDRVKHWITLNELWSFSSLGYGSGVLAPGRCTPSQGNTPAVGTLPLIPHRSFFSFHKGCNAGDSGTEPYKVAHHLILAHAAAVKLYKDKYQAHQKGKIGMTNVASWVLPYSESTEDRDAAQRLIDFKYGWFMEPLTRGRYPENMQRLVGSRLPKFTEEESKMTIGSYDFLGLNYFSSYYAINDHNSAAGGKPSYYTDYQARITRVNKDGVPIGRKAASDWLYVYPEGIWNLLLYTKRMYNNPLIYITENGVDEADDPTKTIQEACCDNDRIDYYHDHLCYVKKAIQDGVNVMGYFAWSLLDNFEWAEGYTVRFGIHYVDYKDTLLKRHPKLSAQWFKELLQK